MRSLLTQHYPGELSIILVDDHSTDGTATVAQQVAQQVSQYLSQETFQEIVQEAGQPETPQPEIPQPVPQERAQQVSHESSQHVIQENVPLTVLKAKPLPSGWTGKLWALEQGTQKAMAQTPCPDYILLTDADIDHDTLNLQRLVTKARSLNLDLASVMVRLRCESVWEQSLIPAFVFFFQKLYPFRWVNIPHHPTAAAAGGCILIRPTALKRIGGISAIRDALIDDCTLAHVVKWGKQKEPSNIQNPKSKIQHPNTPPYPIWLGLSTHTRSLRPYPSLKSIWDMVARTAYTQLHYSPLLLVGTLGGMVLVYLIPIIGLPWAILTHQWWGAIASLLTWGLMAIAYSPSIRFYQCPIWFAFCLPGVALLYTLMTLDSALRYWRGQGGQWKGRTYS
ncbi:MAG: glycosyl transferase family 2 [Merismopedia sp. SIO2A8]|nr:glycosyl transferase family 2 [Symploca sp. SIO2B6]NET50330.1 glycosyl transferase family 2 [Merismopedia sp. SIO2A8]